MHEYSIVSSLIDQVQAEAEARGAVRVHRLRVRIGELSGVEISLLTTAYETFRERTVCAGASLEIETVPARWTCRRCGVDVPRGAPLRCLTCSRPAQLAQGDEIFLDQIEMEVNDV